LLKLPPLVGMLLSGVVLANVPGDVIVAMPESWLTKLRAGALAVILSRCGRYDNNHLAWEANIRHLATQPGKFSVCAACWWRSGLELDLTVLARACGAAMRLTACPGIVEAVVVAGAAAWMFHMPIALGLTLGFILAAVSPAVVVSGMFDLQTRGYGVRKGIPSIVVAAASFDDVLAIPSQVRPQMMECLEAQYNACRLNVRWLKSVTSGAGYALCIGIAVPSGHSLAMDLSHGPISIAGGLVAGTLAGLVLGSTRIWNTHTTRTLSTLILGQLLMCGAVRLHYTGAGAMGSLIMAIVGSKLWASPRTPIWYSGETSTEFSHETEQDMAQLWCWVAQPILFGVIGTVADFRILRLASIPKALVVIACGIAVRLPTAALVIFGAGLTVKER
jgi:solute carrier family 9B (sodium/hydrogen exchanger), member 1/2